MDNIQDRDRAAVVNKRLKILDKEFRERRIYRDRDEEILMLKPLLYRILILSYTPLGRESIKDQEFKMELYQPADSQREEIHDDVLELLCGGSRERVKIEEAYLVKELCPVRHLPIAVGYMLQKGISNIDTEGKFYLHVLRFMAYWVFELDMRPLKAEQERAEQEKAERAEMARELLRQAYEECANEENAGAPAEQKEMIATVVHEYLEMLKKYFRQYLYRKREIIYKECEALVNRIDIVMG